MPALSRRYFCALNFGEKLPVSVRFSRPFSQSITAAFRSKKPCARRATACCKAQNSSGRGQHKMEALGIPEGTDLRRLVDDAVAWASQHGLVYGYGGGDCSVALVHAPVAVLPTPFPRASFEKARRAMQAFNLVTDRITCHPTYLQETLASAAALDEFTSSLLRIHEKNLELRRGREGQQVVLAINRSDYMMDEPSNRLLQVEMNTIASSFGALSTLVSRMHRYLFDRAGIPYDDSRLPPNDVISAIADAMAAAVKAHGSRESVMVMIVQPGEKNSYDQQWIQLALWERHGIRTLRRSLSQIHTDAQLDEGSGKLTVDGREVALAYFRAGYSPDDYPSQAEWDARDKLERSNAALCPSVAYQLAGAKKVQQDLASTDVLQRFLDDQADVELLQACFAGLWGLEDLELEGTRAVLREAQDHPEAFVLKPQREGGGNNLYGEQLAQKLGRGQGLAAYILMQRIRPPIHRTLIVREGEPLDIDSLSELGIFGVYLRHGKKLLLNQEGGHLVRTKASSSDEGGVAAGFAVLDSPFLTD